MRTPPNASLGDFVREARVARGDSLREIARQLKVSPSYLSDIENDRRVPSETVLRDMARLLSLDFDLLMARAGRLEKQTERLLKRAPAAAVLFRRLSDSITPDESAAKLLTQLEQLEKKGARNR